MSAIGSISAMVLRMSSVSGEGARPEAGGFLRPGAPFGWLVRRALMLVLPVRVFLVRLFPVRGRRGCRSGSPRWLRGAGRARSPPARASRSGCSCHSGRSG
ncbi:hypothetical protein GCM10020000_39970 [Streptomyces olivoverticillatus]